MSHDRHQSIDNATFMNDLMSRTEGSFAHMKLAYHDGMAFHPDEMPFHPDEMPFHQDDMQFHHEDMPFDHDEMPFDHDEMPFYHEGMPFHMKIHHFIMGICHFIMTICRFQTVARHACIRLPSHSYGIFFFSPSWNFTNAHVHVYV